MLIVTLRNWTIWCICSIGGIVLGRFIDQHLSSDDSNSCVDDCDSLIFCKGKDHSKGEYSLLHDVQTYEVYQDGITFVQKKMKFSEEDILKNYTKLKKNLRNRKIDLNKQILKTFIDDNFQDENLNSARLTDFKDDPAILSKVNDTLRPWLSELNILWKNFSRETPQAGSDRSSLIPVPNTFIIAGNRFKEMYYWDSYWIIKGLLACEMYDTSRGIIENMIYLVEKYGHVPNGNRVFYVQRSQPPMLIQMADIYYKETKNRAFIKNNLKTFEKEFLWWLANRHAEVVINGQPYHMFTYRAASCYPRPESYNEDYNLIKHMKSLSVELNNRIQSGIRSAAESGWDFSSRHMINPENAKNYEDGLRDMNPQQFAYVDLNTIMYSNAKILAQWQREFGCKTSAELYDDLAEQFRKTIENVLWNETVGMWLDYDMKGRKHRNYFYPSNLFPLWGKTYGNNTCKVDRSVDYLMINEIIFENFTSRYNGVPTSLKSMKDSKQQWDYPNVWAPLQSFIIQGLQESNNSRAQRVAYNLASAFVSTAYKAYYKNNKMYEKYDGEHFGQEGEKGEYKCAIGFGWTNGLIFQLFTMWNNLTIVT